MKQLICIFFLTATSLVAQAQQPFTIGPKAGLHSNTLQTVGDNFTIEQEYFKSVAAGAFMRISIGRMYVQPEGYWTTKGADFVFDYNKANQEDLFGKVRLRTFDVPVLLGMYIIKSRTDVFNLRTFIGPVFSTIINEKINDFKTLNRNNYKFNKSDAGIQLGGGMDIGKFSLDFRYETGLSDFGESFNQRNKLYLISVAYKII